MENGTFNKIKQIGNCIIKISKNDSISNEILTEFDSKSIDEYISDINSLGINTPKLYFNRCINGINIMIQEYIPGLSIQDILMNEAKLEYKLSLIEQFLKIYNVVNKDSNLCLDWNLKNFIVSDDIYYVDFIPCLYKDKIKKSTSSHLQYYKDSYLNQNIQLMGIFDYMIVAMFKSASKDEINTIFNKVLELFKKYTNINIYEFVNHPYFNRIQEIINYINNNDNYEDFVKKIKRYPIYKRGD